MLFELRRYHQPSVRHSAALVRFLGDQLVPALQAAGVQVVGCFNTVIGPQPGVSLLLAFPDANAWQEQLAAFEGSEEWRAMEPGLYPDGQPLVTGYQSILLRSTSFSTDLAQSLGASESGVFEERIYYAAHDRAHTRNLTRMSTGTQHVLRRHGMHLVGFWEIVAGAQRPALYYLIRYNSLAERMPQWAAFTADPERAAISAAAEVDGPLLSRTEATILQPAAFSPLR